MFLLILILSRAWGKGILEPKPKTERMNLQMKLECVHCGHTRNWQQFIIKCPCGGRLEVKHDVTGLDGEKLKGIFRKRSGERMSVYASGVWRYKELIFPELPEDRIVTKYEGNTYFVRAGNDPKKPGDSRAVLQSSKREPQWFF